jgi:hypothetical protein
MKTLLTIILICVQLQQQVVAQQTKAEQPQDLAPPGTEIILANISINKGYVKLTNEQNITSRKGYDSQPVFLEKGKALYFTRYLNKQTDIYRMDLKTRTTSAYMQTPESEYSATQIAGREGISVVRVETDGVQHLYWLHKKKRKDHADLMSDMEQIGYHNWTGKNKLWMFVINGEQGDLYYQTTGKKPRKMASNIGRAIKTDAKGKNIYYVDKSLDDWWIKRIDGKKLKQSAIVALPKGVEDFTIDSQGNFWCGQENTLFYSEGGKNWMIVKEFSVPGLNNITRIAVNPQITQIAITMDEKAQ